MARRVLARENTVESFRAAFATGAGGIELDVRRSADGALVVHHDAVLEDGRPIVSCHRDELPAHVPTLAGALDACRGAIVDVEIKNLPGEADFDSADRIADAVVALLGERPEPANSWLISSFRRETIDRCRAVDPGIATGWLTIGAVTDEEIAWAVEAGHAAIHPWDPTVDRRLVERCHQAGCTSTRGRATTSPVPSSWRHGESTASVPTCPTCSSMRWRPDHARAVEGNTRRTASGTCWKCSCSTSPR